MKSLNRKIRRGSYIKNKPRLLSCEPMESRLVLATFTVSSPADTGSGSLREAITLANANAGKDTIEFSSAVYGAPILIASPLFVTDPLSIDGPGEDLVHISGGNSTRIFDAGSTSLEISSLTLADGNSQQSQINYTFAAGVRALELTARDVTFLNNASSAHGGAVFALNVLITDSRFVGNSAQEVIVFGGDNFGGSGGQLQDTT